MLYFFPLLVLTHRGASGAKIERRSPFKINRGGVYLQCVYFQSALNIVQQYKLLIRDRI